MARWRACRCGAVGTRGHARGGLPRRAHTRFTRDLLHAMLCPCALLAPETPHERTTLSLRAAPLPAAGDALCHPAAQAHPGPRRAGEAVALLRQGEQGVVGGVSTAVALVVGDRQPAERLLPLQPWQWYLRFVAATHGVRSLLGSVIASSVAHYHWQRALTYVQRVVCRARPASGPGAAGSGPLPAPVALLAVLASCHRDAT